MRKERSLYNIVGNIISYGFSLIFNFITQAIFIKMLGIEYLGINGLFNNILTMLSLTELGVGTTITYKLYKPIADGDKEAIKSWMLFYKRCYNIIAIVVLIIGIILIPFLPMIVGDVSVAEPLVLLYMIQIMDSVLSYCMTYKRSLLYADQKNYIINFVHVGYIVFMNITQILILCLTQNYILYLLVKLLYRILENVVINVYVNKAYPYMKESAKLISKSEQKDIFSKIRAIFIQKVSFVINKGIDNIIISIFLGVTAVGYYTNYFTIISAVCSIIFQIMSSFAASIGNMLAKETKEKCYNIYKKINMLNSFLTGMGIVFTASLIKPFVKLWIGDEYILSNLITVSFIVYLYCDSIRRTMTMYKDASGLFIEDRHMYVIMTLINLVTSIVLCKIIGMAGVIIGTALAYLFLIVISYPKYVFKKIFDKSVKEYHKDNALYAIYMSISVCTSLFICQLKTFSTNIIQLIFNFAAAFIVGLSLFVLMFHKKEEYKELKIMILNLILNFRQKLKKRVS